MGQWQYEWVLYNSGEVRLCLKQQKWIMFDKIEVEVHFRMAITPPEEYGRSLLEAKQGLEDTSECMREQKACSLKVTCNFF